jgi:hypothetical protein
MKTNYKEWLIERSVSEFNLILLEVALRIPELEVRHQNVNTIGAELLRHYNKEVQIQSRYGGIRNPAMVMCNKIRHELTNYDDVRDAMTDEVYDGYMDECEELQLRLKLIDKVNNVVASIIEAIPCPLEVPNCKIDKSMLQKSNNQYTIKEKTNVMDSIKRYRC